MSLARTGSSVILAAGLLMLLELSGGNAVLGQTSNQFPGGWVEKQATATRPRWSVSQIQSFVPPTRGAFTFPAPYNTTGVRITDASDCGGADCVNWISYSYWRNTNAHQTSNTMWIFVGLDVSRGGAGPTLFQYDKNTDAITKVGPMFPPGSKFLSQSGEGWYFAASLPNKLYVNDGAKAMRYDVVSQQFDTVYDVSAQFGTNRSIWQMHSSNDDLMHSATLVDTTSGTYLGCVVFNETTRQFSYFAATGPFNECYIDKSGRYLMIEEGGDGMTTLDNLYIDLQTGTQTYILNQNDALGHYDMGYGYVVGADGYNPLPNAAITYSFAPTFVKGSAVFYNINWNVSTIAHVSHANASPGTPMNKQFACGSYADRNTSMQNEITCFRLDTSYDQLVVAPVMTNLDAAGGCCAGDYAKEPKGNLDLTGKYFIWSTNLGGSRLDAFLVKVPSQLISGDVTPPSPPQNLRIS